MEDDVRAFFDAFYDPRTGPLLVRDLGIVRALTRFESHILDVRKVTPMSADEARQVLLENFERGVPFEDTVRACMEGRNPRYV